MKRKAGASAGASAGAEAPATSPPAPKRVRQENPRDVTTKALEFLDILRNQTNRSGRCAAATFESLPDRNVEPFWYERVQIPLSLGMIQTRLEQHGYPTVSSLEGDLKRMLLNWKETHKKSSQPWKDADDVEMFMTNYFKSRGINPQRDADSRHVAPPTPLPGSNSKDGDDNDESMSAETPTKEEKPRGSRIVLRRTSQKGPVAPSTDEETLENQPLRLKIRLPPRSDATTAPVTEGETSNSLPKRARIILHRLAVPDPDAQKPRDISPAIRMPAESEKGFEGLTMTEAQEKILEEMMELQDELGTSISGPFVNLPSRELRDYYATIKHPLSIKGAQKLVRGVKGRDKPTGTTFLETWQSFDEEISHIWNNARLYNEDESEIAVLAGKLEKYFNIRVTEAKKTVPDPVVPKLKLSVGKHIDTMNQSGLNLNGTLKAAIDESKKYSVDEDALRRQKELVANGVNGNLDPALRAGLPLAPGATSEIKAANTNGHPEFAGFGFPDGQIHPGIPMPPPATIPSLQSAVPHPTESLPSELVKKPWDTWLRCDRPEQFQWPYHTIMEVTIMSHPALNLGDKAYKWDLGPFPKFNYAQQILPMRKSAYRILLSPLLIQPTRERPVVYHFVTLNGVRLQPSSSAPKVKGLRGTEEENLFRPVYDIYLDITDMNELMVECSTGPSEVCDTKDVMFDKHIINIQPREG